MTPTCRQVLFTCLLLAVIVHTDAARRRRPVIPGKTQPQATQAPVEQTQNSPNQAKGINSNALADMERRMANVEESTSVIKSEMREAKSENTRLKEEIQRMGTTMEQLDEANQRVEELERMLSKFENFFGVLYTELPDVFAEEMSLTQRFSRLNSYLGNKESELMMLRPNPPFVTADPAENPVDEELLGLAVDELNMENTKLRRRLDDMETRMVAVPPPSGVETNDPNRVVPAPLDDDTQERLTRLERLMALKLAPLIDEEDDTDNVDLGDLGANKRLTSGGATVTLSDSDAEILRTELDSVRSIASTRKSVFSAAATRHMHGEAGVHKPVSYDHIFSNKGGHFQEQNSTFICSITGYYFITFTTRSYDNRYLGVSLLLNGERVMSVSAESDPVRNQMMSQSLVLHLTPGDQLWVTVAPSTSYSIHSDQFGKYSTFSGFLLFKGS